MSSRPLVQNLPAWYPLAADAFRAAQLRNLPAAGHYVRRIADEHGPDVIPNVLLAWIDTALHAAGLDDYGEPAHLTFGNLDNGDVTNDANDVDPLVAWSARLVNARLADDPATFDALLAAAQASERTWGEHVLTLLNCLALTTNGYLGVRR